MATYNELPCMWQSETAVTAEASAVFGAAVVATVSSSPTSWTSPPLGERQYLGIVSFRRDFGSGDHTLQCRGYGILYRKMAGRSLPLQFLLPRLDTRLNLQYNICKAKQVSLWVKVGWQHVLLHASVGMTPRDGRKCDVRFAGRRSSSRGVLSSHIRTRTKNSGAGQQKSSQESHWLLLERNSRRHRIVPLDF